MDKKCPECKQIVPEYMATYGDLVTLLMCFFVLLFAFSEIDAQKFDAVMQSFQGSAGVLSGGKSVTEAQLVFDAMPEDQVSQTTQTTDNLQILKEIINDYIEKNDSKLDIKVELTSRGLVIRFPDNALFDSGKAELKKSSIDTLKFLGQLLNDEKFSTRSIRIEGHTDNVPIKTFKYPSNWELSTSRATNVAKFFIDNSHIDPVRLAASGFSEYHPIAENTTRKGRARNRRVDVVVLNKLFETEAVPNN
ncbi:OmpA/MotB family protein [Helicovermis profundi]|uniref:Flagellar motor protein MotB n=1 Tax=Helicovermis profundi TaxID=3065157 RepID=A0AAU9E5M5_9FIRM|nr:flagellar motor protein MotB [Clostridia bacterium S502]